MEFVRVLALPVAALLAGSGMLFAAASPARAEVREIAAYACPKPDGNFGYPADQTKYIQCKNNVGTLQSCPQGLVWNRNAGYCDWPANAGGVARRE
ncbi:carbohydrate-binding module family 14 protein [Nocardia panacis]|uniref:carbohydrate-binding module family 14 protein n=1 Tax=Nocardia panacis TaxID=2340916 RepID=UPI0013151731|nr:carbohydrate-binding module family 14 protein [Nocardia panacis]